MELTAGLLEIAHDGGASADPRGTGQVHGRIRHGRQFALRKAHGCAGQIEREESRAGGGAGHRRAAGPHHPSFVIQTPGVMATNVVLVDGGAEFGVAVEPTAVYGTTAAARLPGAWFSSAPEMARAAA